MNYELHPELDFQNIAVVLEKVNGLFLIYDTEGEIKYVNSRMKSFLDYSYEDIYRMNVTDLVIERHKKRVRENIRTLLPEGRERISEMPLRGNNGREFFVIIKTSPLLSQQRVVGEIIAVEDITDSKKAADNLRESQRFTADIIESLPDPTVVIDRNGRVLYWNREMVEITGFSAANMVGRGDYEYALPFYGKRRPILIDMIVDDSLRFTREYEYVRREGNVLYTETKTGQLRGRQRILWGRAAPLFSTRGDIVGAIESVRDITDIKQFEDDLVQSHAKLEAIFSGTVSALASMTEKRDQYTAGHQQRVAELACAIAREMGLPAKMVEDIKIAGTIHDIGKLYVPLDILSQTGKLTDIEFLFIKTHPTAGYDILKSIPFDAPIAEIVLQHHERMDGSGYPKGLKGEDILLQARIVAVADVVEAMGSHRPYRPALGIEKALEEIQSNAGRLYDPVVVGACVRIFREHRFEFTGGLGS